MKRKIIYSLLSLCLVLANAITVPAGGWLDDLDITGFTPSPIFGQVVARVVPIRWDNRSIPVKYSINTTQDPIFNPLGDPVLSLADARTTLQAQRRNRRSGTLLIFGHAGVFGAESTAFNCIDETQKNCSFLISWRNCPRPNWTRVALDRDRFCWPPLQRAQCAELS